MRGLHAVLAIGAFLVGACSQGGSPGTTVTEPSVRAEPTPATTTTTIPGREPDPVADPIVNDMVAGAPASPTLADLSEGWSRIEPGGETGCTLGAPYAFWVRPGDPEKLLIYFQGGGACFDAETCSGFGAKVTIRDSEEPRNSSGDSLGGILDAENPENTFADYSVVYVGYCSGDNHLGNNEITYTAADGSEVDVQHSGFINAASALGWAMRHYGDAEQVFVTGCSSGAVGSILLAPYILEGFSAAEVRQLGDSGALIAARPLNLQEEWGANDNFPAWIPALAEQPPGEFVLSEYYAAVAAHYPTERFGQFNFVRDSVQTDTYLVTGGGSREGFSAGLTTEMGEIEAAAANFKSFTGNGGGHCLFDTEAVATYESGGVSLCTWIIDFASGEPIESVTTGS